MDKKRLIKSLESEDVKGFEEFIEGYPNESLFLPKGVGGGSRKNESRLEHFTFLTNDAERLIRMKKMLSEKLPFSAKFDQSHKLIRDQRNEIEVLKQRLFDICDKDGSGHRKTIDEIFDGYFEPVKKV